MLSLVIWRPARNVFPVIVQTKTLKTFAPIARVSESRFAFRPIAAGFARGALSFAAALMMTSHAGAAAGGGGNGGGTKGKAKGKPSIAERPVVIPRAGGPAAEESAKGKPTKPDRPGNATQSTGVKNLVQVFQDSREAYLQQQKALAQQYKTATTEERKAIREQLKELLDRLKEQQRQFREEVRERAKSLKKELDPSLGRLIDKSVGEDRGR